MRNITHEDQRRNAEEKLDALLQEGLESGLSTPMAAEDWAELRYEVQRRVEEANVNLSASAKADILHF